MQGRQSSYLVNFRSTPSEPWNRVRINPVYNKEWNDFSQNWEALKNEAAPNIDDMVDQATGLPKDMDDPNSDTSKRLKEIESAGCQNCPNPELEQILFTDVTEHSPTNGQPLYAMTIRGWLGATSSLVMFGKIPGPVKDYMDNAEQHRKDTGMNKCQIKRNAKAELEATQYSKEQCAQWLREGALWDLLTHDASKFGFDIVGQFRVRDNCTGGENSVCNPVMTSQQLNAAYMFTDTEQKLLKAWTIMQLLGEVGMRTLGMSYASSQYGGYGLDFAMAQPAVYNSYYTNMADPDNPYNNEMLFALDARALQLPTTLGLAADYLNLN